MIEDEDGPEMAADYDDSTDPRATCTVRRRPLWPGQKSARCDQPLGHWPKTDHHWIETP